jgi:hypothetical protein
MAEHLILPAPISLPSRRAGGAGGQRVNRDRPVHGNELSAQLSAVVDSPRRLDHGVDPSLVFKVRTQSRPTGDSPWEGRGLQVLSETRDFTYFVLAEDDGAALRQELQGYSSAGTMSSLFDVVEGIEAYGAEDRRGPGLPPSLDDGVYLVDISIWPSVDHAEAVTRANRVASILESHSTPVLLRSTSARRNFIRAQVSPDTLNELLELSVIETIRTPPVPFLDFRDWRDASPTDFEIVSEEGGSVGVLDDAPATSHPLLNEFILSSDTLSPPTYQWQQAGDHGTEVVGRIIYPRLHEQIRDGEPLTAVGGVRVVRILEPDSSGTEGATRFATYDFPHVLCQTRFGTCTRRTEHGSSICQWAMRTPSTKTT